MMNGAPVGRNDPCPCGSGRKYKLCCADKNRAVAAEQGRIADALRRGLTLERQGRITEALAAYQFAAGAEPEARSRMGHLLAGLGRWPEAVAAFRTAGAEGTSTERRLDAARALLFDEREDEAADALRGIVADDPRSADAWRMLAHVRTQAGAFEDAAAALDRSLAINPRQGAAWYELAHTRRLTEEDRPLIARMLAAVRGAEIADEKVRLHLALGKAFDDLDDPRNAMRHFIEAARTKAPLAPFDRERMVRRVDALIAGFSSEFVARHAADGDPSRLPVMVLGQPRSGTTLVEQILSCHPAVAGAGELFFWLQRDPLLAPATTAASLARTARDALAHLHALAPEAERVIDKNPFNFFRAGLIHIVFPRATIIHCRRQPIDTCLSILGAYLQPRPDFPATPGDLVFYQQQCARLADHWRAVLPAERFIDVDYERLVAEPEAVARSLVGAMGLAWDEACLRPELNLRSVRTLSKWQVRQPIHRKSVERWRRYEPWLGDLAVLAPAQG
jgi:tetratricopeptide (TPR) repeat protein